MKIKLLDFKKLDDFPSGSGIEFFNDQLYLVGDDAKQILILSKRWKELDRIEMFAGDEKRISKSEKADLESTTIITESKLSKLFVQGSGSREPQRNFAFLIDFKTFEIEEHDLTEFYNRVKAEGIISLNIEACAVVDDHIIFGNRANEHNPHNCFIITEKGFWKKQADAELVVIKLDLPLENLSDVGVSGLTYSVKNDSLIFTASTERTKDAVADGNIGDSYIGIIENPSRKIGRKKMKVNAIVNLRDEDEKFSGYKIESVCIQSEKEGRLKLHLVADNDTGKSYLFKIRLKI